jgi:hypothetical protein
MKRVNRWAVVIRPKARYYAWANDLADGQPALNPDDFIGSVTVLLIPDQESRHGAETLIVSRFEDVFEHYLRLRVGDPLVWPQPRTLATFNDWFEVEYHENAIDLGEDRIRTREVAEPSVSP